MIQAEKTRHKVMFVVTKSNFGGAQRYVFDLATHIDTGLYEIVVVSGRASKDTEEGLLIKRLKEAGVRTIYIPELSRDVGFADFKALRALVRAIKVERPDVLHLNSSKVGGIGAVAGRIAHVPRIIFTAHGWAFRESRNFVSKTLIWLSSVATILLSHTVICVSTFDRNSFAGWFFVSKCVVIHNAVSAVQFLEKDSARAKISPDALKHASDIWIGTSAELTPNKDISLALESVALARAKGARIYYVISGEGEEREMLARRAEALGLTQHVYFAGYVPDAQSLLHAFDATLLTSKKEGLPYAILESLRAGIPPIASMTGGIPEIVRDKVNGVLCPPGNAESFADALELISKDDLFRTQLQKNLVTEPNTDFEMMLRETFSLYTAH